MEENTEVQDSGTKLAIQAVVSIFSGILTYAFFVFGKLVNIGFWGAVVLAPITAIIAIATGINAKKKIRQSGGLLTGIKLANAGLWLGWIYILLGVLVTIGIVAGMAGLVKLLGIG